jgi:hypothetical protein
MNELKTTSIAEFLNALKGKTIESVAFDNLDELAETASFGVIFFTDGTQVSFQAPYGMFGPNDFYVQAGP